MNNGTDPRAVLDGIKAQLAAATPGPWTWSAEKDVWGDCGPNLETVERGPVYSDGSQGAHVCVIGSWGHDANGISVEPADAEFIAAAPVTVTRLSAAVEAVLTLHKPAGPTPSQPWVRCDGCTNGCGYPCPTVAAIENALKEDR